MVQYITDQRYYTFNGRVIYAGNNNIHIAYDSTCMDHMISHMMGNVVSDQNIALAHKVHMFTNGMIKMVVDDNGYISDPFIKFRILENTNINIPEIDTYIRITFYMKSCREYMDQTLEYSNGTMIVTGDEMVITTDSIISHWELVPISQPYQSTQ